MLTAEIDTLKYPVGKFNPPNEFSPALIAQWIQTIEELPKKLRTVVSGLDDTKLDTPYREGGWTIRQVVHHLADSHLNCYIRFRWTMTEDSPVIKTYNQDRWSELDDAKHAPVEVSLSLLDALHKRWLLFVRSLSGQDLERKFHNPESKKDYDLRTILALYAWHSNHHLAHITSLLKRKGWSS